MCFKDRHVNRLAVATRLGQQARLLYLLLQPATGEVRDANARSCPPLLLDRRVPYAASWTLTPWHPLGTVPEMDRCQGTLRHDASVHRRAGAVARWLGPQAWRGCESRRVRPSWTTSASTCSQHVPLSPTRRRHLPLGVRLLSDAVPTQTEASEHCRS